MNADVIIIGSGASGLAAARALSTAGKSCIVLEARERPGGRIHTIHDPHFSTRIESGPEFIHGVVQHTLALVKEAGLNTKKIGGAIWNMRDGKPHQQEEFMEGTDELMKALENLRVDISIQQFLDVNFPDEKYSGLRESVLGYIKGYELADPEYASALALRESWSEQDDSEQRRIEEGYSAIIDYLMNKCHENGCTFDFNSIVKKIEWKKGAVKVETHTGEIFNSSKALITVPVGVWQSRANSQAHIEYVPHLPEKIIAARAMGFGDIIKFIYEFKTPFWEAKTKNAGFIFSNCDVPTWWTQREIKNNILTGWLGGPDSTKFLGLNERELISIGIQSLASIYQVPEQELLENLAAARIFNWSTDNFSLGGYSYKSLKIDENKKVLRAPVDGTLYFAGEALSADVEAGTVEAALASGMAAAGEILVN